MWVVKCFNENANTGQHSTLIIFESCCFHSKALSHITKYWLNIDKVEKKEMSGEENDCVLFMFQFTFISTTVLSCIGMLGNTFMFMVLHHRMKRNGANFLLKILAITYNMMLLCSWAYVFLFRKWHYFNSCGYYCHLAMKYVQIVWRMAHFTSVWMVVFVVMCRWKAANFPHRASIFLSYKVVCLFVSLMLLFAFICRIPEIFHYQVTEANSTNVSHIYNVFYKNLTRYSLEKVYENEPIYNAFKFIERSITTGLVPAVLLLVYSTKLYRKTKGDSAKHPKVGSLRNDSIRKVLKEELEVSHAIVAVAAMFIICYSVFWSSGLLSLIFSINETDQLFFEKTCNARIYYCIAYDAVEVNALSLFFIALIFRKNMRVQVIQMAQCKNMEIAEDMNNGEEQMTTEVI